MGTTSEGQRFLRHALGLLEQVDRAIGALKRPSLKGRVRLGVTTYGGSTDLLQHAKHRCANHRCGLVGGIQFGHSIADMEVDGAR